MYALHNLYNIYKPIDVVMDRTTIAVDAQTHNALKRWQFDERTVSHKPSLNDLVYDAIPDEYKDTEDEK